MNHTSTQPVTDLRLPEASSRRLQTVLWAVAGAAALVATVGWVVAPKTFYAAYLTGYLFLLSLVLGALFWVLIHHVMGARWSVVIRRPMEHLGTLVWWLAPLLLPIVVGLPALYPWADGGRMAADPLLALKRPYMNLPFFVFRAALYFLVWGWLAWRIRRDSLRQDANPGGRAIHPLRRLSGPGLILLGVTATFASFDWIMALDPHWFSTIFGVYFWSGGIVGSLAAITLVVVLLRRCPGVSEAITVEHLHDLGKLLFAFVIFWAYIAFSQYMLIWYANIPEETGWYLRRAEAPWIGMAWCLLIGHFALPFAVLLFRDVKRSPLALGAVSVWLLLFHWLDLYWQVMPTMRTSRPVWSWLDFVIPLGFLAGASGWLLLSGRQAPLLPVGDPRLTESLQLTNE